MMTFMQPVARDFTRFIRVIVVACVLVALFVMQAAVFKHAFEHLVASASNVPALVVHADSQIEQVSLSESNASRNDYPAGGGCQRCLEDAANTVVLLPDVIQVLHADLSYCLFRTALPHNLPFLAPERANQRGPPLIV